MRKITKYHKGLLEVALNHIGRGHLRSNLFLAREAKGCQLWDVDGNEYLDFTSGIGVLSTGHCHPKIVKAVQTQCEKLSHCQMNISLSETVVEFVKELLSIVPQSDRLNSVLLSNTGAEAVENAIKLARYKTGSYHGRTNATAGCTSSKVIYRQRTGPHMPGIFFFPHPYSAQMPKSLLYKPIERVEYCMDQVYSITNDLKIKSSKKPLFETFAFNFKKLKLLLRQQSHPDDTAALLIEPILGEGGYVVPPNGYLEGIQNICKENGIMLMLDEVQSGFGRTGEFFAFSHFRTIEPDVLIIAKGIGSGYPISAVISSKENTDFQPPMTVGGTYAGNVVSCAAAKATIETIKSENLIENCRKMGGVLIKGLMDIKNKFPEHILEIRGIGLMIALEFRAEKCVNNVAAVVVQMCAERGVLLMTTSVFEVIRLVPPLVIKEEEIKKMLNVLEEVMDDVFKRV